MIHRLLPWVAFLLAVALLCLLAWDAKAQVPAAVQRWLPPVERHVVMIWQHERWVALHGAVIERESGGRPDAGSHAGAVGLGQFMLPTWKEMVRLHPQFGTDRRDPNASIALMVRYLKRLHSMHKAAEGCERWLRTLASYNCGPNCVLRRIRQRGAAWARHLPAETRHYIQAIPAREPVFIESGWPGRITCPDGV